MNFVLSSESGSLVPLAVRLEAEGHSVLFSPTTARAAQVGGSDVTRGQLYNSVDEGVVVTDHFLLTDAIGSSTAANALDDSRINRRVLEKLGFELPVELMFSDANQASAMVRDSGRPFNVVGGWEQTIVCSSVRETVNALRLCNGVGILLRRHVKGAESVEMCWLDKGTVVPNSASSLSEYRFSMTGGLGVRVPCSWATLQSESVVKPWMTQVADLLADYTGPASVTLVVAQSCVYGLRIDLRWIPHRVHAFLATLRGGVAELLGTGHVGERHRSSFLLSIASPTPGAVIENLPEIEARWMMNYTTSDGQYVVGCQENLPLMHLTATGEDLQTAARLVYRMARRLVVLGKGYCVSTI